MNEPLDIGNQRHVEKRQKSLKAIRLREDEAFRWLMADERGRRFAARLLRESEALVPRVAPTVELALFKEGRRAHGLAIIQDINRLCPHHLASVISLSQGEAIEGASDERN